MRITYGMQTTGFGNGEDGQNISPTPEHAASYSDIGQRVGLEGSIGPPGPLTVLIRPLRDATSRV